MSQPRRRSVYFTRPYSVEVVEDPIPTPAAGEVLVRTAASAISAGTEMLFYRGAVPDGIQVDATIAALGGTMRYPISYGYAAAGTVIALGADVDPAWLGRRVFAFQPHHSHFTTTPVSLIPLPDGLPWPIAVLLPNLETAVNLLMDGAPLLGEQVVVFGQGIVGLLTTALLSRFPLSRLTVVDPVPARRAHAQRLGAHAALTPAAATTLTGADLVYELSGNPAALDAAIRATGFGGRIVVGSWYGRKPVTLDLGGHYHRSRIHLIASQVSTLAPQHTGRWTTGRRLETALDLLQTIDVTPLITHTLPIEDAPAAYRFLDQSPDHCLQIVFTYDHLNLEPNIASPD